MTTITWIPVTERLPDADQTVLVWTRGGEWFSAWYDDEDTGWRDGCTTVQMQGDNEVTHWAEPLGPAAALAEQPVAPDICTWYQDCDSDSDLYSTSCGSYYCINEGTPEDNKMRWCCYCGNRLIQELITGDDEAAIPERTEA